MNTGTPVWNNSFAPAINTFLDNEQLKNKKIFLFACHAGGGAKKCFNNYKERLSSNEIVKTIDFKDPIKDNKEDVETKINSWLENN